MTDTREAVLERAREINKRIHLDCSAPYCSCNDGICGVSEAYISDALLAEHARAEAAERERDDYRQAAEVEANERRRQMRRAEAAEATVAKIEAEARRYAAMYAPHTDGRNTFVIFADWIAALSAPTVPDGR